MNRTTSARSFRPFFTTNFWPAIAKLAPYIGNRSVTPPSALFDSSKLPPGAPWEEEFAATRLMWERFSETHSLVRQEDSARSHNCITIWVLEELKRLVRLKDDRVQLQFDQMFLMLFDWWYDEEGEGMLEVTQANNGRAQQEIDFVNNHCKVGPAKEASTP